MLDAYIIDRIRREREEERRDGALVPLHIEVPRPVDPERERSPREEDHHDRGSVVIDFQL